MDSTFFSGNRKNLAKLLKSGLYVMPANAQLQKSADITFKFQQDSNFRYLTGIDMPDLWLICDIDNDKEYLVLPKRVKWLTDSEGDFDREALSRTSGISTFIDETEAKQLLKKAKIIHGPKPLPTYVKSHGFYSNPARKKLLRIVRRAAPSAQLEDLLPVLAKMRQVKQPEEIKQIEKAVAATKEGFKFVTNRLNQLKTEAEVEAVLTFGFAKGGSITHAYDPIVASGKNAVTLHYVKNDGKLKRKDLLLIDAGAEFNHYASDVTRTYNLGDADQRQMEVYSAVSRVHKQALQILKAGMSIKDFEQQVGELMFDELEKLKIIKKRTQEGLRKYYPHNTSHFVGLDVHDAGSYTAPLPPNSALTVEPGIYIPEEGIGVRIEDTVVITKTGVTNLSKSIK